MTVVAIDNLSHVVSDIYIDGTTISISKDMRRKANSITPGLRNNISQINNYCVHIITNQAKVQKVQEFMEKYLDETVDKIDEETKKMISHDNNKSIQSGRDISLPFTIMTHKEKIAGSISNPWKQQRIMNSNDAQSTEDSIVVAMDKLKISD